jgi:hypothetical protein
MPKRPPKPLLEPLKGHGWPSAHHGRFIGDASGFFPDGFKPVPGEAAERSAERLSASLQAARDRAAELAAGPAAPTRETLTPDHPYSKLFGYEEAKQLLDPKTEAMKRAAELREGVRRLSLAKRRVKDIAEEFGISPDYVSKIRARLRSEGKLPR